jgi:hypothetical protein
MFHGKKFILFIAPLLILIFASSPLLAVKKLGGISLPKTCSGYLFTASYILHTPSAPSGLQVNLFAEYNMRHKSICQGDSWLPFSHLLQLRFTLNNEEKIVDIWKLKEGGYEIWNLDSIRTSIWYHAIKKLADNLGSQFHGGRFHKKIPTSKGFNNPTSDSVYIQPLNNHKLQSFYYICLYPKRKCSVDVSIEVQEELYRGKRALTGTAVFQKDYSPLKFLYAKNELKQISKEKINFSPKVYATIKKAVQNGITHYSKLKRKHYNEVVPKIWTTL